MALLLKEFANVAKNTAGSAAAFSAHNRGRNSSAGSTRANCRPRARSPSY